MMAAELASELADVLQEFEDASLLTRLNGVRFAAEASGLALRELNGCAIDRTEVCGMFDIIEHETQPVIDAVNRIRARLVELHRGLA